MQALTVKVPWSFAIAHGPKRVENRGWPPPRDLTELAIHAGARSGWDDDGEFSPLVIGAWRRYVATLPADNLALPWPRKNSLHLDFKAVVAVATVTGFHHDARCVGCSEWSARDQFHWQLADVRTLATPVPCGGHQKLWSLPDDVESAVMAQLAATEVTHLSPCEGHGLMPCCGLTPFEVPRYHRMTEDPALVTCAQSARNPELESTDD